jgi:hypothetical protein
LPRRRRRCLLLGERQLLGDRRGVGSASDLEVVSTTAKIDDPFVVRVLEDANEHAVTQTLGVAAKQLTRMRANIARPH